MGHRRYPGLRHHRGKDGRIYWYSDTYLGGRPPKGVRIYVRHGAIERVEAETEHREILGLARRRILGLGQPEPEAPGAVRAAITFAEAGTLWLKALEAAGRDEKTIRAYRRDLAHSNKYIGTKTLSAITLEDLEAMRVELRNERFARSKRDEELGRLRPLAFRTRQNAEHIASSLFNFAMHPTRRWAEQNPFSGLVSEQAPRNRERRGELFRKLHPREDRRLLEACKSTWHRAALAIGLYLGVRETPVASLRLEDVNLFVGAIRVPSEFNKSTNKGARADQWLPIPRHLLPPLTAQVKAAEFSRTPWLFPSGKVRGRVSSTGHIYPGKLREIVSRTAKTIGYDQANFHALRAICNNRLRAAGIAEALEQTAGGARAVLGHASEQTAAPYIDASVEYLRPIIEAYDRWLDDVTAKDEKVATLR